LNFEGHERLQVFNSSIQLLMNTPKNIPVWFMLCALAAVPASAAIEPLKIEPTYTPQLSPVMLMEGVTDGRVVVAINISADGKLTDWLVLAYTHRALVANCVEALKEWKFVAPRIDGVPVPVQTELTINFNAEGVVISRNTIDMEHYMGRIFGQRLSVTRRSASDLDAAPVVVAKVTPKYAAQAEQQGVKGRVTVHFYIDEKGAVRMPSVEGDAHPYLAQQAIAAMREWRFSPPTAKGKPVMVAARQDFQFSK
jgi:TonB family protein